MGLGISVPLLISQIINFTALFFLLYLFAYKPILRLFDRRAAKIRENLEAKDSIEVEKAQAEEEMKKRLEAVQQQHREIVAQATHTGEEIKHRAEEEARKEAESLISQAKTEIQLERDNAMRELRQEFANLVIQAAEKVISEDIDREKHLRLIDRMLKKAEALKRG